MVDRRDIKSSSGEKERRHVIRTPITLGDESWEIEITLTNRDSMGYRMLIGREAMKERVLIDPDSSFCLGSPPDSEVQNHYKKVQPKKEGLKILLLASNPELYSNQRILEAGEERGHDIDFIDIRQCYMNISAS